MKSSMMVEERPVGVMGLPEVTTGYRKSLSLISVSLKLLEQLILPKLIVITGPSGSGKSLLANVLAKSGDNVELINCKANINLPYDRFKITEHSCTASVTYLIDDALHCDQESLNAWLVDHVIDHDGIAILFVQHFGGLELSIPFVCLSLSRLGVSVR